MTKQQYKFLFFWIVLIISFGLTATLLVLDAVGYKVNWSTWQITKTGLIVMESTPRDVSVYIDGKLAANKTPLRLDRMVPERYEFELKKAGYKSWSRLIQVEAGLTTELESVVLFLETPIVGVPTERDVEQLEQAVPDERLYVDHTQIHKYIDGAPVLVTRLSQEVKAARMYPDRAHIAYQVGNEIQIVEEDGRGALTLLKLDSDEPVTMVFVDGGETLLVKQHEQVYKVTIR